VAAAGRKVPLEKRNAMHAMHSRCHSRCHSRRHSRRHSRKAPEPFVEAQCFKVLDVPYSASSSNSRRHSRRHSRCHSRRHSRSAPHTDSTSCRCRRTHRAWIGKYRMSTGIPCRICWRRTCTALRMIIIYRINCSTPTQKDSSRLSLCLRCTRCAPAARGGNQTKQKPPQVYGASKNEC
jgi:hypothetical protein